MQLWSTFFCFNQQKWLRKHMKRRIDYYTYIHFYPVWCPSFLLEVSNLMIFFLFRKFPLAIPEGQFLQTMYAHSFSSSPNVFTYLLPWRVFFLPIDVSSLCNWILLCLLFLTYLVFLDPFKMHQLSDKLPLYIPLRERERQQCHHANHDAPLLRRYAQISESWLCGNRATQNWGEEAEEGPGGCG